MTVAFVLGNGTSRKNLDLSHLNKFGKIYGCNALYREYRPDYLVAVDVKMILEINEHKFQLENQVWTNPTNSIEALKDFHYQSVKVGAVDQQLYG